MIPNFAFLEKYRDYGAIFIRLIIGFHLNMFPALMMLSAACFFLLHGAGKLSVDAVLEERKKQRRADESQHA